ncbi:hypothetical protein MASR2M79_22180 [Aminivibrio sp.]
MNSMLSMKLFAKAAGAKKAEMAAKQEVERPPDILGVSPLGRKRLRTFIHSLR